MPVQANKFYNSPALGAAFSNLSAMFAPPSGAEAAGYATAAATKEKASRLAQMFADAPDWDRKAIAADLYDPTSSFYAQDQADATTRRGDDLTASTTLATNAADNRQRTVAALYGPLSEGQVRPALPGGIAGMYDLSEIPAERGVVALSQGERAFLPDGSVMDGAANPLSETEWKATQAERLRAGGELSDDQLTAAILGSTPTVTVKGPDGKPRLAFASSAAASGAEPAVGGRPMTSEERQTFGVPEDLGGYIDGEGVPHVLSGTGTKVSVNTTAEGQFEKTVGEAQGKLFVEMAQDAVDAKSDRALLGQLRGNIENLPGGFVGGAQSLANSYGIKLGPDASAVEAADAIINRLVPGARQGMPGATSDRDVAMFRASLPKLSNTREGNRLILDTLEAMAAYREAQGRIATAVITGKMTRADGLAALQDMPDPMAEFKAAVGSTFDATAGGAPTADALPVPQTQEEFDVLPSGARYRDPDDGRTYRKP